MEETRKIALKPIFQKFVKFLIFKEQDRFALHCFFDFYSMFSVTEFKFTRVFKSAVKCANKSRLGSVTCWHFHTVMQSSFTSLLWLTGNSRKATRTKRVRENNKCWVFKAQAEARKTRQRRWSNYGGKGQKRTAERAEREETMGGHVLYTLTRLWFQPHNFSLTSSASCSHSLGGFRLREWAAGMFSFCRHATIQQGGTEGKCCHSCGKHDYALFLHVKEAK